MEQSYPGGGVAVVHTVLLSALQHEEEGLGEAEQEDDVDDGECEHVSCDHGEDHGHKGSGQFDGSGKEHEIEPGHRDSKHQQRLLDDAVLRGLLFPGTQEVSSSSIGANIISYSTPGWSSRTLSGIQLRIRKLAITNNIFGGEDFWRKLNHFLPVFNKKCYQVLPKAIQTCILQFLSKLKSHESEDTEQCSNFKAVSVRKY